MVANSFPTKGLMLTLMNNFQPNFNTEKIIWGWILCSDWQKTSTIKGYLKWKDHSETVKPKLFFFFILECNCMYIYLQNIIFCELAFKVCMFFVWFFFFFPSRIWQWQSPLTGYKKLLSGSFRATRSVLKGGIRHSYNNISLRASNAYKVEVEGCV